MTTAPPGWYPDPSATSAPQLRWWDGRQWGEQVSPALPPVAPTGPAAPTTPDGAELAGWGRRLGAWAIDGAILGVVGQLLQIPLFIAMFGSMSDLVDEADPVTGEVPGAALADAFLDLVPLIFLTLALTLVLHVLYHALFLRFRAATPGKLILGLRVRRWDADGPLGWGPSFGRAAMQYGVFAVLSFVALHLVDGLWPLWDERRQALHDKVVGTVVVRQVSAAGR